MIIFTDKNDPSNTPIRDNLDGIDYTTNFYPSSYINIIEQVETLSGFTIPEATKNIDKDSRNVLAGTSFNSNSFDIEIPNLYQTDFSINDINTTAIFFYTESLPLSGMTITTESVTANPGIILNGSLNYDDTISKGVSDNFNITGITNCDEKVIIFTPERTGVIFFTRIITDVKSNMELLIKQSEFINFDYSIIDKKLINLAGISNIENEFLVLNEDLTEIIYKGPLSIGNFTKPIISKDSKVHIISIPKDEGQNFIPFRNILIS